MPDPAIEPAAFIACLQNGMRYPVVAPRPRKRDGWAAVFWLRPKGEAKPPASGKEQVGRSHLVASARAS
jgi:hypothetical protein